MFGSTVLDVGIGLILLFLILSLMASAVSELVNTLMSVRARMLEQFVRQLFMKPLTDEDRKKNRGRSMLWSILLAICFPGLLLALAMLVLKGLDPGWLAVAVAAVILGGLSGYALRGQLFLIPFKSGKDEVDSLVGSFYGATTIAGQTRRGERPAYIRDDDFSQAVLDVVLSHHLSHPETKKALQAMHAEVAKWAPPGLKDTLIQAEPGTYLAAVAQHCLIQGREKTYDLLTASPAKVLIALVMSKNSGSDRSPAFLADVMNGWKIAVASLPAGSPLRAVLDDAVSKGQGSFSDLQNYIGAWYNSAQQRVTGWYKGRIQITLLAIGLILAIIFNVDTIAVANKLLINASLRDAISQQAKTLLANPPDAGLALTATAIALPASPLPEVAAPGVTPTAVSTAQAPSASDYAAQFNALNAQLTALNLPLGWSASEVPHDVSGLLLKIIGILISAFAVTQGAPFWFDLLNKVVNLRGSGEKPKETAKVD